MNRMLTANWKCGCGNVNNIRDDRCNACARMKDADMRILPGFIVTGLDAPGLVDQLSRTGELRAVLDAACALYGLQLRMSEDVAHTLEAVPTLEAALGRRIAHTIAKANIGQSEGWWMYNCTFRFFNDKADVAIDGLVRCNDAEAKQQGPGEAIRHDAESWGNALNEAAWVFAEQCPEKSALLFNNTKTPLRAAILKYLELVGPTAPQVEAKRQTGEGESPSLKRIIPAAHPYPKPDQVTGADTGSIGEHAYADGWNDCRKAMIAAAAKPSGGQS